MSGVVVVEVALRLLEVVGQDEMPMVVVEEVQRALEAGVEVWEPLPFLVVGAEALREYLLRVVEVEPVLDLGAAAEPLMAPYCQQRAEAHRTSLRMVYRHRLQVSSVVLVEAEDRDL